MGGAPLDVLAERFVFAPLGMNRTGYHPQGDAAPTEADPATLIPFQGVVSDRNARFLGGISANAGVFSDLEDMIRFGKMLACGGAPILRADTLRAAIADRTPDSAGEHRGLGFLLASTPGSFLGDRMGAQAYGHTGFTGTSIAVDPDTGLWVVLLTNRICPTRTNTKLFPLRPLIHNAAAEEARRLLSKQNAPAPPIF